MKASRACLPDRPRCSATASAAGRMWVERCEPSSKSSALASVPLASAAIGADALIPAPRTVAVAGAPALSATCRTTIFPIARAEAARATPTVSRITLLAGSTTTAGIASDGVPTTNDASISVSGWPSGMRLFLLGKHTVDARDDNGRRLRHFGDERRQFLAGHRAFNRHARLGGKRQKTRIAHARVEGAAQKGEPLGRNVRRREIRLRRLLPRQHEQQCLAVSLALRQAHEQWHIGKLGQRLKAMLHDDADLPIADPFRLGVADAAPAVREGALHLAALHRELHTVRGFVAVDEFELEPEQLAREYPIVNAR